MSRDEAVVGASAMAHVAYLGRTLPKLSETFVLDEVFAVREAGVRITAVSVFQPPRSELSKDLLAFADSMLVAYGREGWCRAAAELCTRPARCAATLATAVRDMLASGDANLVERLQLPLHAVAALGIARSLRARQVEHIHAHMANTPTTVAMYAAMQLGIGFSFTGHASDLFVHRSFLPEKLRRATFVACISWWHRGFYRRFLDLPDDRLPVIHCGVDTARAHTASTAAVGAASSPALQVLSVGRLVPKKGMDTLIRAVGRLGPAYDLRCQIVGDGPLRESLAALIRDEGLEKRVELLGARPHTEVLQRVQECDVFVLACQRDSTTGDQDGIPVALMEAMAATKCVIASALEPVTELVIDGQSGLCVPASDPDRLAAAIRRVHEDVGYRRALADGGRRHVEQEFERHANARRLAALFRAAAGQGANCGGGVVSVTSGEGTGPSAGAGAATCSAIAAAR